MSLDPETIIEDPSLCVYPEEYYDCYGNFIDFRSQYIGEWEFSKTWGVTHPYNPSDGDQVWTGLIEYGTLDNTIIIPLSPTSNNMFYIDELGQLGEYNNYFNYSFEGYFIGDSILFYTGTSGSPFSTTTITINAIKIE